MKPNHETIFEPIRIGKVKLKNRIALAPTHVGLSDHRGTVTDQMLCYYYERAVGGPGLVIVEITAVSGRFAFIPGRGIGLASNSSIPGFADLSRVIHWGGARAFLQLAPGHGAQAMQSSRGRELVGPSDVPAVVQREDLPNAIKGFIKEEPQRPRPVTIDEITALREDTVRSAERAKTAGFDGIEIHGAHGYLLSQFTSPYYNRRNDEYGGSPEKRWRFSNEIIRDIKKKVGKNFVVGYRFSAREWIPDGIELSESIRMAQAIQEAGADYLSISQGCYGAAMRMFPKGENEITQDAGAIRKAVDIPVMCPNFQDPDIVAAAISEGMVDIAALSRPLLVDPYWVKKVEEGRPDEIKPCKRCYTCIKTGVVEHHPVRCPANPKLGFERFDPACFPRPAKGWAKKKRT